MCYIFVGLVLTITVFLTKIGVGVDVFASPHHQHGDHGEEKKIGEGGDDRSARPLPLGRP